MRPWLREGARKAAKTQRFGDLFSKYLAKTTPKNQDLATNSKNTSPNLCKKT
jgi:hypothetical protein